MDKYGSVENKSKKLLEISKAHFENSNYEESLEFLSNYMNYKSIFIAEADYDFILDLIVKLIEFHKYKEVIKLCDKLLEIGDSIENWAPAIKSSLGLAFRDLGEYGKAIQIFQKLIKDDQNNPNIYYLLGTCYEAIEDLKNALEQYKSALKNDPRYLDALHAIRAIYHKIEDYSNLERVCNKILQISNNDIYALNSLAIIAIENRKYERAIRLLNNVIQKHNKFLDAWLNLGIAYKESNSYQKAIEAFNIIIEIDPEYLDAWRLLANTYFLNEEYQHSLEIYKILLERDGKKFQYLFGISLNYFYLSNFKKAELFVKKALNINPNSEQAQFLNEKLGELLKNS